MMNHTPCVKEMGSRASWPANTGECRVTARSLLDRPANRVHNSRSALALWSLRIGRSSWFAGRRYHIGGVLLLVSSPGPVLPALLAPVPPSSEGAVGGPRRALGPGLACLEGADCPRPTPTAQGPGAPCGSGARTVAKGGSRCACVMRREIPGHAKVPHPVHSSPLPSPNGRRRDQTCRSRLHHPWRRRLGGVGQMVHLPIPSKALTWAESPAWFK